MKKRKGLIIALVAAILVLGAACGGMLWFLDANLFVGGMILPRNAQFLNLRDKNVSVETYDKIREEMPECEIYWMVPFQDVTYTEDTTSLRVKTLSDADVERLDYLTRLKSVNADGCTDYEQILALQQRRPEVEVSYTVTVDATAYPKDTTEITVTHVTDGEMALLRYLPELRSINADSCTDYPALLRLQQNHPEYEVSYLIPIGGREYDETTTELSFKDPDINELVQKLQYLTNLETVMIQEPTCEPAAIIALDEAYPGIDITWEKKAFGKTVTSKDTEIDLSGMSVEFADIKTSLAYFPNLEKVIMVDCGYDNETMAAFREEMRSEYKVVWAVTVTGIKVRTDETVFHSSAHGKAMIDEQTTDLYYCEDMIVVDVGHSMIKYIPWVEGMPNLKYLILADNWLKDITPISSCKNLIYLELFINEHLDDVSPLLGCTSLQDLSVSDTYIDPEPLAEMTWLENLWINNVPLTEDQRTLLETSLPDTHIEFDAWFTTGNGWCQLQNYFDMRDIMGLPYNAW